MKRRKTFEADEPVEFIRDTDFGRPWEPGRYLRAAGADFSGWHWVRETAGFENKFLVPARRLRKKNADG